MTGLKRNIARITTVIWGSHLSCERKGKPRCVVCSKVDLLAGESMLPSKLERHLTSSICEHTLYFYSRKVNVLVSANSRFMQLSPNALLACYQVGHRIARSKMPHTSAEELILPAAIELVRTMKGKAAQHFKLFLLITAMIWLKKILPLNLRSIFLQRPSKLEICSVLSREFIKL